MTVIFPHSDDPVLEPYLIPIGRMLFGYGRAMVALREIAQSVLGSEKRAVEFMRKVKGNTIVEKFRELCKPKFPPQQLERLLEHCTTLAELSERRNRIVHGLWWFDVLGDGGLRVRDWIDKDPRVVHDETITPQTLNELARKFSEVSSDLDSFSYMPDLKNSGQS